MELSDLLFPRVTLPASSIWVLCWSRGRLEVGSMFVPEVVLMDMLNSVAMSVVLRWVRGVLLKLTVSRLVVVDTFSLSIPGFRARLYGQAGGRLYGQAVGRIPDPAGGRVV
jgi:hypothetical protein